MASATVLGIADILRLSERIAPPFSPERIVLFGSYAEGHPTPDSDVDLLVIMPHKDKAARKSAEILTRVQPSFGVDLLVRTPEEVRRRLESEDFFLHDVLSKGRVLYEAAHP